MKIPPESVLASWPKPNYVNPEIRGHVLTIIGTFCLIISTTVVALRAYTRWFIVKAWGLDDVLICLSILPVIALSAAIVAAEAHFGWNRHVWDLPLDSIGPGFQIGIAVEVSFGIASMLMKLSLLFFYRRVFALSQSAWLRPLILGLMGFTTLQGVIFSFIIIFQCSPVKAYWSFMPTNEYHCINENLNLTIFSSINTFTDFAVVLVPISPTLALQMSPKQRLATLGLFLMAGGVCIVGTLRSILIARIIGKTYDLTWEAYPLWITTAMEAYVGLILVSLPSLRPLINTWFPDGPSSHRRFSGSSLANSKYWLQGWRKQTVDEESGSRSVKEICKESGIEMSTEVVSIIESTHSLVKNTFEEQRTNTLSSSSSSHKESRPQYTCVCQSTTSAGRGSKRGSVVEELS